VFRKGGIVFQPQTGTFLIPESKERFLKISPDHRGGAIAATVSIVKLNLGLAEGNRKLTETGIEPAILRLHG